MASLDDMQRLFFCGRAGDTATRCGLPPCHCSTPPCDRCGGALPPPQLAKPFTRIKRFNVAGDPKNEFDVVQIPDQNMTQSCSNYVDDGTTVFSEDGKLVLKVASACADGRCLNSGRVMSKDAFTYGIFTFSAKVPKCHSVWPALWLLPGSSKGDGRYGPWPCSGEIDVLETVNGDPHGAFNLVAGFGSTTGSCFDPSAVSCNACAPPQYCTSTTLADAAASHYFVEDVNCDASQDSWREHLFVLYWQPEVIAAFVDPELTYDASGHLTGIQAKKHSNGQASYKVYHRSTTPTWSAVQDYMGKCFPGRHSADAPFDIPMPLGPFWRKIVLNIAVGGYGGAPCFWGVDACQEIAVLDIAVETSEVKLKSEITPGSTEASEEHTLIADGEVSCNLDAATLSHIAAWYTSQPPPNTHIFPAGASSAVVELTASLTSNASVGTAGTDEKQKLTFVNQCSVDVWFRLFFNDDHKDRLVFAGGSETYELEEEHVTSFGAKFQYPPKNGVSDYRWNPAHEAKVVGKEVTITFQPTVAFNMTEFKMGQTKLVQDLFHKYDKSGDGILSEEEMLGIFEALSVPKTEVQALFQQADANRDGKIQVQEFISWLMTEPATPKGDSG
ncbi:glcA [Symbiodinium sp. CCMP2456]|nr:glcA [Symbiodinium sp. CCMP2456]